MQLSTLMPLLSMDPTGTSQFAVNRTVYIIRHGEKTWEFGCLNKTGQERADALVNIFNGRSSPLHATFGVPQSLFANHYDDPVDCERCHETLTPISVALSLPIIFDYGYPKWLGGNSRAAKAILAKSAVAFPVLVAWEHRNIRNLTADLGVEESIIPDWSWLDFDTVYMLNFSPTGAVIDFQIAAENFVE
uniref:Uncharacterized protein n=1 Tax=Haptolina brevifila TaxID=156173 RepID=A0A7S2ISE4_9EUKA|mmetsp:Transcript_69934/g.138600  ORF Transcript_69934/g.138600 Transcript_69934/m.138600 type:complete len:190 (+) Transcript_69934:232-801(+)|eukprot:CAMPEP_0174719084 /NCGR_PEP_ID=MMETSP1094-20130205/30782_1 /TAXON_ID=156173 /ORGANISM="Chrysochromulina brevifilum, Strain UTEX LB 985" /LENGTH=189 /DNA_ID=CAMNT_0015919345 /DNA_START=232 /DNA_END=801 /DNA_ORIENTATION=+